jgi:hypothetical protein
VKTNRVDTTAKWDPSAPRESAGITRVTSGMADDLEWSVPVAAGNCGFLPGPSSACA